MSFLGKSSSNEILIKPDETAQSNSIFFSVRFLLAFFIFLAAGTQYMQKIDISIAIVCMVNSTESNNASNSHSNDTNICLFKPGNETKVMTFLKYKTTSTIAVQYLSIEKYLYIFFSCN